MVLGVIEAMLVAVLDRLDSHWWRLALIWVKPIRTMGTTDDAIVTIKRTLVAAMVLSVIEAMLVAVLDRLDSHWWRLALIWVKPIRTCGTTDDAIVTIKRTLVAAMVLGVIEAMLVAVLDRLDSHWWRLALIWVKPIRTM